MAEENKDSKIILDQCPHCGHKLSPWQQVLLSVDRALMCKNCWYRIILDDIKKSPQKTDSPKEDKKEE
ncbi:MAG: hypothetical protein QY331_09830 [Melioribacteraceae bacterium]|nr:prepilin peptidase [Melioribacteraceae bacterium]WKZ68253.1 MAG: hypothetical protein QY331_09830 [Melioribacteraceae bacterium]